MDKNNRIGERKLTKYDIYSEIIRYKTSANIDVKYDNGYIAKNVTYANYKKDAISNPYIKNVCGVGYYGKGKYVSKTNGKHTKEYLVWRSMIIRCYDKEYNRLHPTYEKCTVCEEWHNFQVFAEWFHNNYYTAATEIMDLDKDFLIKGNKLYSPETCMFIPQSINKILTFDKHKNKNLPSGVYQHNLNKKFYLKFQRRNEFIQMGDYETESEAVFIYLKEKEKQVKEIANEYIKYMPPKVYDVLNTFELT